MSLLEKLDRYKEDNEEILSSKEIDDYAWIITQKRVLMLFSKELFVFNLHSLSIIGINELDSTLIFYYNGMKFEIFCGNQILCNLLYKNIKRIQEMQDIPVRVVKPWFTNQAPTMFSQQHNEQNTENIQRIEHEECLKFINGLLKELNEGDEVNIDDAIEIIQDEGNFKNLSYSFIEAILRHLANSSDGMEYIRLKRSIKINKGIISSDYDTEEIFANWITADDSNKNICMVCKTKIAEKQNFAACPHCEGSAHISHIQEWLKLNNICPNCRKPLNLDEIIIVNIKEKKKKNVIEITSK